MTQINEKNAMIPASDAFSEAFTRFQDSRQFKRLQDKYKVKPFFERAKTLKVTADVSSYFLNVFSASTAFLFVFSFLTSLLPWKVLAGFFALAFLVGLEALKRFSLPVVFRRFFQFKRLAAGAIAFSVLLSLVSVVSSYFGAKEAVRLLTPEAELVSLEAVRTPFEARLQALQADKADAMKQTWKGKQTVQAAKRLNVIQQQEAEVQTAMLEAVTQAQSSNNTTMQQHTATNKLKAEHFAAVTLLFELLLVLALWYVEFYDFRSLAEFSIFGSSSAGASSTESKPIIEFPRKQQRTVVQGFTNNAMRYNENAMQSSCLMCGNSYERKTSWQKYCTTECRLEAHALKHSGQVFDVRKRHNKQTV